MPPVGQILAVAEAQAKQRASETPPGYFGPVYQASGSGQAVGPIHRGWEPVQWAVSANSFLQGTPRPRSHIGPPKAGVASSAEKGVWQKPKTRWEVEAANQQYHPHIWPPMKLGQPVPPPALAGWETPQSAERQGQLKRERSPSSDSEEDREVVMYTDEENEPQPLPQERRGDEILLENYSPISSPESLHEQEVGGISTQQRATTTEMVDYDEDEASKTTASGEEMPSEKKEDEGKEKGVPEKFKKRAPPTVRPKPEGHVDWVFRLDEIDISIMLYEAPTLWIHVNGPEDPNSREAVSLMEKVRKCTIRVSEFAALEELYGIYLCEIVKRAEIAEMSEVNEVTSLYMYRELAPANIPGACPGCHVFHPIEANGAPCPPRGHNSPKVLSLIVGDWSSKMRGMLVGLNLMRVQPAQLKDVLLNASFHLTEARDYNEGLTAMSSEMEVGGQNLYKTLKGRVDMIKDHPELVIMVEYGPMPEGGLAPGAFPISWGPIKIIQMLQRLVHNPVVLVLPSLPVSYGMTEIGLKKAKVAYMDSARELAAMCRALGVPFVPLAVHMLEVNGVPVRGRKYRPEFLWNKFGEPSRELQQRISDKLVNVIHALAPVILTKAQWLAAIDTAT